MNQIPKNDPESKLRIFKVYHEDSQIDKFNLAEDDVNKLFACHLEVEGDNINRLRPLFAEIVAMYWVWKNNVKSEWIGFQHYHDDLFKGVDDMLVSKDVCVVGHAERYNMFDQYRSSFNNGTWDVFENVLSDIYGKNSKYHRLFHDRNTFYQCCSFVMAWDKFTAMCEEMFKVAKGVCDRFGFGFDVQKYLAMTNPLAKSCMFPHVDLQERCMGHILERFISAWISLNFKGAILLHRVK